MLAVTNPAGGRPGELRAAVPGQQLAPAGAKADELAGWGVQFKWCTWRAGSGCC